MNAPEIELIVRFFVAITATASAAFVRFGLWTAVHDPDPIMIAVITPKALVSFLAGTLVISAIWRWFILWLGFQTDLGEFGWITPWIQPMNASFLFLVYLSITLLGVYFYRQRRAAIKGES